MIIVYAGVGIFCIGVLLFMAGLLCNISASNKLQYIAPQLCDVGTIIFVCGCLILTGGVFYALLTDPMTVLAK